MTAQERLAARCDDIARLSREALAWINDDENAEKVSARRKELSKLLRKGARRAERLSKSAKTKMSVSVFGPSQAGKSFLVSVLARPKDGRLVADFQGPGGTLDYISQINPAGDGESTGLVTRFTMSKDPTPDGFPIKLNLLTEADIARTIVNSFFEDGDQSEAPPDAENLKAHFATHSGKAGGPEVWGLSFEDIYEIAEYVEQTFGKTAYAAGLKGFWDDAAYLAPRMSVADRGAFLSILWGGYQELTDLYVKLASALARIDHAEVIYAGLDALQPRETSIIDVNTLQGLFQPEDQDQLTIRTAAGKVASLNRAVICALAAELVFPMMEQPSDFFAETDLLDFPGARNRFELPLAKTLEKPEEAVTNMLLRGKVSYLFDRYVANQEITSMLLCVPDSNMETLSLPGLVDNWIEMTHGATPAERARNDCILFFVMTKFDKHLGDSASGGTASERFERRMDASLLKGFGKVSDNWVHRWTDTAPFRNCYWLRNPNYFVEGLINYNEDETEREIRPEKVDRVGELKAGCLATPSVQAHFKEPERAWDAALTLNDGGVGYLTEQLTLVCKPESKLRQIANQVESVASSLLAELAGFHVSDDIEKRVEEKRALAGQIIDRLELTLQGHRFGALLHALCVDQDLIQDRISRVDPWVRLTSVTQTEDVRTMGAAGTSAPIRPGAPVRPGAPARPGAPLRPGAPARPEPAAAPAPQDDPATRIRTMTPEAFQADGAIDVWMDTLGRLRDDEHRLAVFHLTSELISTLMGEMAQGFQRLKCRERMMGVLREIGYGLTMDKQAAPGAVVCSEAINRFVTTLGADDMDPAERPVIPLPDGGTRPVFPKAAAHDRADTLPATARAAHVDTWSDWVFTLEALFVGNAMDGSSGAINIEQNQRIGQILNGLGN
ncbi:virulence factor SrfC family protein [Chachezhania sediminis]|uniref:virulence factor SrfC family protein n=1 Tax=Chachezhania sediminis TaxID=2599291 RepID=UPI00131D0282|nr:virulence factor SrfC family protein [Chachezhania sediminis]